MHNKSIILTTLKSRNLGIVLLVISLVCLVTAVQAAPSASSEQSRAGQASAASASQKVKTKGGNFDWVDSSLWPSAAPSKTYRLENYAVPGKTPKSISTSSVQRSVLPNGLRVLVQDDPDSDMVCLEVLVRCSVSQEGSNLSGYTNFILNLLDERLSLNPDGSDAVEILGTMVNTSVSMDYARISITTTPGNLPVMQRRLNAVLVNPRFTQAETEKMRKRLVSTMENSGGALSQLYGFFLNAFYRYHPYKRSDNGDPVIIGRAKAQDINAFYQHFFVPDRMVYSVAGRAGFKQVFESVRAQLSAMKPSRENLVEVQWEPEASERDVNLSSASTLAWVLVGYSAPEMLSSDYPAMKVLSCAWGEGLSSRIWTELREKRGLAYELGAKYPELLGPSHLLTYVVTQPGSTGQVRRRIFAEADRMKDEGLSRQELADTKRKLIGNYLLARESCSGRALNLAMAELSGAGYDADANLLNLIEKVTAADVQKVAQKYMNEPTVIMARPGGRLYFDFY